MARSKSPVRSQMSSGHKTPSPHGPKSAYENYHAAPFSAHPHDVGTGGIPVKVGETLGEKVPSTHSAAFSSPKADRGGPAPGQRRY
jgi:hypothetical protein